MHTNLKKIKSAILSGMIAAVSVASSLSTVSAPSLSAGAADSDNYAKLLQYSLYFYDANMCGDNSKGGLSWRSNCHMDDEVPGGFHDAGDHVMFGLPQGYTAAALGLSYYEFKDAYEATGQADHIKVILDHFCTYFRNSTKLSGDSVSNFLYQKGEGNADHGYWGPPETQGSGRKMYWTSNGASDIAANYAAALAINYKNFGNADDLKYAKALYNFSTQYNQCATVGPDTFYASSKCKDEQTMAAGALALATGDSSYKNALSSGVADIGVWWAYGWNDANLGAAVMNGIVNKDWSAANGYLSSKCTGSNYLFLDKWGSARLNCSMQFTALVATKEGGGNYTDWAQGQMNYILGSNPANTCFVTGFASNSAKNAHHRAASGYTSYDQFNMNGWDAGGDHMSPFAAYGPDAKPLIGALVGGPCDAAGSYHDNMADYVCNEVAIDYNAGLVGAAAGLYHFKKTGSTESSIPGVTKIYSGSASSVPTPQPATNAPQQPVQTNAPTPSVTPTTTKAVTPTPSTNDGDIVLTPSDMTVKTEIGDDKEINNYAEFKPQGAKSATLYLKVNSNDTEVSGAFGTWNGEWVQEDFKGVKVNSDKTVSVDYTIPSDVGSTVKAMVFWPHGDDVTIEKVVLHKSGSSTVTPARTNAPTPSVTPTTTKAATQTPSSNGNDKVLTPSDMTVKTEIGDDKEINNYAEFKPQGAKSATLYLKVNSNDTEVSGAFGTWNGEWVQEDFKGVKVNSDKTVSVDYKIPSDVGSTVKAMVFWPHGDDVTIEKVVLHMDGSSSNTPAATQAPVTTKPVVTTTKAVVTQPPVTQPPATQPQQNQVKATVYGDANLDGDVTLADALAILQYIANSRKYDLNDQAIANADCCGNGDGITANDALVIQQIDAGRINKNNLPVAAPIQ
ncbi:MAG TPA: glycoside hydrolase family 9 protein [Ruminococcus sp.]|nr:glycoside hydrolase family 9 protein [Ruminococcus sp.]